MGEAIMFLGIVALILPTASPVLNIVLSTTLLVMGGNICVGGRDK